MIMTMYYLMNSDAFMREEMTLVTFLSVTKMGNISLTATSMNATVNISNALVFIVFRGGMYVITG